MRMTQIPTIDTPQPRKIGVSKPSDSTPIAISVTNRLVATGPPAPDSAGRVKNSRREGDALLRLLHPVGRTDGDAPLIHPARRPSPVFRTARLVAFADTRDLGCVFDDHFVRPDEIREYVVAGSVPTDAPFDGKAAFAQTAGAAHDVVDIGHLEGNVVERRRRAPRERQDMMLLAAAEKGHRPRLIDDAESEMVDIESADRVNVGRVQHDMREPQRPIRSRTGIGMPLVAGDHAHGPALGILECKAVAAARLVDRSRFFELGQARFLQTGVDGVDFGLARRGQVDAQQFGARTRVQAENVMVWAGAAEIHRAGMLDHRRQAPNIGIKTRPRLEVGHTEVDAAQAVDARAFGARTPGRPNFSRRFQWLGHYPPPRRSPDGARHVRIRGACLSRLRVRDPKLYF